MSRKPGTERRCIVTGEVRPAEALVRFVVGPDGQVVPDIAGRLPGRGLWVSAQADAIETAAKKGLFSRAARAKVAVPPDLAGQVRAALTARLLDLLGLAKKAGQVTAGLAKVEEASAKRHMLALFLAADAGAEGRRNAARLAEKAGIPVIEAFTAAQLGLALGRANVVHAALTAGGGKDGTRSARSDGGRLASLLLAEAGRLRGFLDGIPSLPGAPEGTRGAADRAPATGPAAAG